MMKIPFTKMHGCGNDFICVDGFECPVDDPKAMAVALCKRRTGVGGDGLILIEPSAVADARMRVFNVDGSEGLMCGNGIRCVGRYLFERRGVERAMKIETISGIKTLMVEQGGGGAATVHVEMGKAAFSPALIPVKLGGEAVVNHPVRIGAREVRITCVSMGNPHCVVFGSDPDALDLGAVGPQFERHAIFPDGVNAEFVQVVGKNALKMRVWERGCGETLACGTGACAAAAAAVKNGLCDGDAPICVDLRGGELVITVGDGGVRMAGPAAFVFDGAVAWPPPGA
jgi:diaminopimelate epimerase